MTVQGGAGTDAGSNIDGLIYTWPTARCKNSRQALVVLFYHFEPWEAKISCKGKAGNASLNVRQINANIYATETTTDM